MLYQLSYVRATAEIITRVPGFRKGAPLDAFLRQGKRFLEESGGPSYTPPLPSPSGPTREGGRRGHGSEPLVEAQGCGNAPVERPRFSPHGDVEHLVTPL